MSEPSQVVTCPCSGRKYHFGCLPKEDKAQVLSEEEVWFSSPGHRHVSAKLAAVCSTGVMPCGQMTHATAISWQLIRGAAVADPKGCKGYAPRYSTSQKGRLRQVLFAARHILQDCFGKLEDSRTGQDLIPWMLQGKVIGNGILDFSGMHLAVLSVEGIIASVALVRAFGPDMAEVPLLATRHELQGNALAPALLHSIEAALLQAGVKAVIMPALPLSEGLSPEAPWAPEQRALPLPEVLCLEAPSAPGQSAAGPKPWGTLVGYKVTLPAQLLQACQMPMVQLPGTCYVIKHLSLESLTQVKPITEGLRLNRGADAEALAHDGVLLPLMSQTVTKAEAQPVTTLSSGTQAVSRGLNSLTDVASQSVPRVKVESTTLPTTEVAGSKTTPDPTPQAAGLGGPAHLEGAAVCKNGSESASALLHNMSGACHTAAEVSGLLAMQHDSESSQQIEGAPVS